MFRYWLQGGRVTVGFLGAAQIDRFGNINTTVIGPYAHPKVRLPGGGGAPEIATSCGQIFITMAQSRGRSSPSSTSSPRSDTARAAIIGSGWASARAAPTKLITDLCVMEPDPLTREMSVASIHPGVTREQLQAGTGWPLRYAAQVTETPAPSAQELAVLRGLQERTRRAHAA